ncbi:MopE-related protein [Paraliomyxa miuraensis]|uniref:MopE-related protein n=1 Tax=Paraliomyxa miuraensis TaxID=376150 RepID=UPI002257EC45|nr:MopE-related protein [Paraliomyxa miuraensis]MCX4241510.1 MopE-related protein [Paraliomyxa miuraensis]
MASSLLLLGCAVGTGTDGAGSAFSVGEAGGGSDGTGDGASGDDVADGSGGGSATTVGPPTGDTDDPPPPGGEICNGLDDDGDGQVDEDQPSQTCGVGSCEVTQPTCVGGIPQPCTPALPGGEVCNGLDDDCNGAVDDVGQACSNACGNGTTVCMGNAEVCDAPAPAAESCNLDDDDCDGDFDEGVGGCRVSVHRFVHPTTGEHFYTASLAEGQGAGFSLEVASYFELYAGAHAGLTAFHRCYQPGGFHLYTQDPGCEGLQLEGVLGYIATGAGTAGSIPLYRLYRAANGDHFYTTSAAERDNAIASFGYVGEGTAGYVW